MADFPVQFNPALNQARLAGSNMVFHCHYYNCAVHKAIEETLGDQATGLFRETAAAAVRSQLRHLIDTHDAVITRFSKGRTLFQQLGFGSFDAQQLTSAGGVVVSNSSHYALGWLSQYGIRETPVCQFIEGYLKALVEIAYGLAPEQVAVRETDCMAKGDANCRFVVEVSDGEDTHGH
ncbi:MAG: 4-vinyl reductase [Leptolyngbyaceae cyanobacterium MO_188.B28]|nr:4-vinyl reductase [Leptolyngbyaceae cyanobacterium MO_188.B28]